MNNNEIARKTVDRLLEVIDSTGCLPWTKPWSRGSKPNVQVFDGYTEITVPVRFWSRDGKPYKGINTLLLAMSGHTGEFITFARAKAEGGTIRKGAKGHTILYWNMLRKETGEVDDDGDPIVKVLPVLKYYTVFSLDDVDGLEPKHSPDPEVIRVPRYHSEPAPGIDASQYNEAAEAIVADYVRRAAPLQLDCLGTSDRAYYSPALDKVVVPNISQFSQVPEYYSTLFHELGHSTGAAGRLNRLGGKDKIAAWGDENYSREELVAEITAASILSTLGMETGNSFRNSAAYVKSWASHIKDDPMMFVVAAGRAEKAIEMILGGAA